LTCSLCQAARAIAIAARLPERLRKGEAGRPLVASIRVLVFVDRDGTLEEWTSVHRATHGEVRERERIRNVRVHGRIRRRSIEERQGPLEKWKRVGMAALLAQSG